MFSSEPLVGGALSWAFLDTGTLVLSQEIVRVDVFKRSTYFGSGVSANAKGGHVSGLGGTDILYMADASPSLTFSYPLAVTFSSPAIPGQSIQRGRP